MFAYGATEPEAGSDLGALKTTAEPVSENGDVTGYRITGAKQWISNGGVADLYTILALAPGGPSWFVVESGTEGFTHGKPEDKHGIRLSEHRGAVSRRGLRRRRPARRRRRGPGPAAGPGGLRLHAADGRRLRARGRLGGARPRDRRTHASAFRPAAPLSEKQGYTHKLIVPHAVALEAARAAIEETAERHRRRRGRAQRRGSDRQVPGDRGRRRGGRRRDPGATAATATPTSTWSRRSSATSASPRIYEGTSEIMEMTIARGPLAGAPEDARRALPRRAARSPGALHAAHPGRGADVAALAHHALADLLERCRVGRLTRNQHVLLSLGALIARSRARPPRPPRRRRPRRGPCTRSPTAASGPRPWRRSRRVNAREAAMTVRPEGVRLAAGADGDRHRRARTAPAMPRRSIAPRPACSPTSTLVAEAIYGRMRRVSSETRMAVEAR